MSVLILHGATGFLDEFIELGLPLLVLGGGGYNPWSVGRCWTGIWGLLNGYEAPARLPDAAETVLRGLTWNRREGRDPPDHWFITLADAEPVPRPIRDALHQVVALMESSRPCA